MNGKLTAIVIMLMLGTATSAQENCFGIIAGRKATADGSVLFGHNEDDGGELMLNVNVCPGKGKRAGMIWAELPGMSVADAFMNEYGVCIASDNCPSKEDRKDFTNGGILFGIRMDAAKYAHSAREAVHIIGRNVEKYGYIASGRSYLVADSMEGWVVSLVQGRHWVAQRVPDDKVMCIPNYYVISEVNLADTVNFLGSADIGEYARERGWYTESKDGKFNFRLSYSSQSSLERSSNRNRHSAALAFFTGGKYDYDVMTADFCVTPEKKVTVQDIIDVLSNHSDAKSGKHPANICTDVTVVSTIFQLRPFMPEEIGCVMWFAPGHPCSEVFVPWYLGMTEAPKGFTRFKTFEEAENKHFSDAKNLRKRYPDAICWKFVDRWNLLSSNYDELSPSRQIEKSERQKELFLKQAEFEATATKLLNRNPERCSKALNSYTSGIYRKILR